MCMPCWDRPPTVRVYVANTHPCALERYLDLDVCDDCEADAIRDLEARPQTGSEAHVVRWAA